MINFSYPRPSFHFRFASVSNRRPRVAPFLILDDDDDGDDDNDDNDDDDDDGDAFVPKTTRVVSHVRLFSHLDRLASGFSF